MYVRINLIEDALPGFWDGTGGVGEGILGQCRLLSPFSLSVSANAERKE